MSYFHLEDYRMDAIPSPFFKGVAGSTSTLFRLILADLTMVEPALLGRIMGKEEAEKYLTRGRAA